MDLYFAVSTFLIIWWLVFLIILPCGIENPDFSNLTRGQDRGAPANPRIFFRMFLTTLLSSLLFFVLYYIFSNNLISLRDAI
ncbi:MAG: hypothetical protein CFH06_01561 [Alphaproteobacteria bacterium MarineAlpha3_Bin5]|nr:MAG: hypothetical protein CFH06_01561 [Alphaproteobacteria bacterium MarineAlpha3_Bin5]